MCVSQRQLCHVRFSTPTLPCTFLNANFATCVLNALTGTSTNQVRPAHFFCVRYLRFITDGLHPLTGATTIGSGWTNILDKHFFITAGLHPAFHHGWFAPCVSSRLVRTLRFITAGSHPAFHHGWFAPCVSSRLVTLPCALFNANFAMCVVQRKLCHVRCSMQTLPCAFLNAKLASGGYPPSITRAQPSQAPWRTGGSYDWASINF
jgi:hypothetical protein